jgi:hypothetical protein
VPVAEGHAVTLKTQLSCCITAISIFERSWITTFEFMAAGTYLILTQLSRYTLERRNGLRP